MKLKRLFFLILGCISLGVGCIGIVLPVLPTVPFFLLTVFCFANSSQKLHDWFVGTKLYKKNLESFVQKRGMTVRTKVGIILPVTLVMGIGFFMMWNKALTIPCLILAIVWICHIVYFLFGVKTLSGTEQTERRSAATGSGRSKYGGTVDVRNENQRC
ncbi:YbaN family protein [Frisingicoccus sp.]|uniref:YbaN family protein n=1 Tax=Frisingicoccus sp. TaxID=1918627 RepID=UPI003AB6EC0B